MAEGIAVEDLEGYFTFVNPAAAAMLGYKREELLGCHWRDVIPPDQYRIIEEANERRERGEADRYEVELLRKDGARIHTLVHGMPRFDDGRFAGTVATFTDITDLKKAKEALARERDLLHALMDNSPDWIFFKDAESRFVRINQAHARLLGVDDPEEAVGKTDFDFFPQADAQRFFEEEQEIIETGQPIVGRVGTTPTREGEILWRSETKVPLTDETGQVTGLVGISRDVTERKRVEVRLRHHAKRLENLREIDRAILEAQSIKMLAQSVLHGIRELVPCQRASLSLYDTQRRIIRVIATDGEEQLGPGEGTLRTLEDFAPATTITENPIRYVRDLSELENPLPVQERLLAAGIHSVATVPLIAAGELIGTLNLGALDAGAFEAQHLETAREVADLLAIAIQQARLQEQLQQRAAQQEALNTIISSTAGAQGLVDLLETALEHVLNALSLEMGAIWTQDQHVTRGLPTGIRSTLIQRAKHHELDIPGTIAVNDWESEIEDAPHMILGPDMRQFGIRASITVPILAENRWIGAIALAAPDRRAWAPEEIALVEAVGYHLAGAIERAQAQRALQASEERYRLLAENAKDVIWTMDENLQFTYVSPSIEEFLGYSAEEAMSLGWEELLTPASIEIAAQAIVQELSPESLAENNMPRTRTLELEHVRRDGSNVWGELRLTGLSDTEGRFAGVLGVSRDIAERKQREQAQAAIVALGRTLAETHDLPAIYKRLYEATVQLLPDIGSLFISSFDPEREIITCAYAVLDGEPIDAAQLPPIPLEPAGQGTQSEAIRTRKPVIVNDLPARLKNVNTHVQVGTSGPTAQSGLYVPMIGKGRVIGVMQVQSYTPNRFSEQDAELLSLAANTAAVTIENVRLLAETVRRLERLSALRNIDMAITASTDLQVTLNIFLDHTINQLGVDAAAVLLLNQHTQTLEHTAHRGFRSEAIVRSTIRAGEGYAGRSAMQRQTVTVPDLSQVDDFTRAGLLAGEDFVTYFGVPLIAKGRVKGILEIFHRRPLDPEPEWLDFMEILAGQAAIAIDNALLFDDLQRSNLELILAYDTTLEGWARALALRDGETEEHAQRVTELTVRLARAMGVPDEDLVHVRRGALLHDIGKMGIPDRILRKQGSLDEDEWEIICQHPTRAYELLSPIAFLRPALDIPHYHHERWDGTGYPHGLKGQEIPLAARIFAVVDVYDALRSGRQYREARSEEEARAYIREQAGKHFDPQVVEAFLRMLESDPQRIEGER